MPHAAWPVDPGMIAPFLAAIILIELTPGPNMAYLAALSAAHGRRAGLMAVAGVTCGLSVYMLAAVFGLTEVFLLYRPLYEVLRWAGVAYLLWMAYDAWRSASDAEAADAAKPSRWVLFRRGLLANLLNPKVGVFYISFLPQFVPAGADPASFGALLAGLHVILGLIWAGLLIAATVPLAGLLREASVIRGLDRFTGSVFIAFGLRLALERR